MKTTLSYKVPYADIDRMGFVYYAHYLVYFERARNELLEENGLPYSMLENEGVLLPVVKTEIEYKKPAHYSDILSLHARLAWARGVRLQIDCEVTRGDLLLASGYTIHAALDKNSLKPIRVPEEILRLVNNPD